jgi:hypothetical protein
MAAATASLVMRCPAGHDMSFQATNPYASIHKYRFCDACKAQLDHAVNGRYRGGFHCGKCKFDLCGACTAKLEIQEFPICQKVVATEWGIPNPFSSQPSNHTDRDEKMIQPAAPVWPDISNNPVWGGAVPVAPTTLGTPVYPPQPSSQSAFMGFTTR